MTDECRCASSPPAGEHLGVDQGGGHHHLHGQEKVHHAGHQPCGEGLRANEVGTTRGRHLPSFQLPGQASRPWSGAGTNQKAAGRFYIGFVIFIREDLIYQSRRTRSFGRIVAPAFFNV